jgi:hypothetical protein
MWAARTADVGDGSPTQDVGERCPWCDQPISHEKFEQIRHRIQAQERQHAAEIAAEAKAQVAKARKDATLVLRKAKETARLQADTAREEGKRAAAAEAARKLAKAEKARTAAEKALASERERQESKLSARLQEQRDALEKDKLKAVNSEKAKAFTERQKMDEKLQLLQRQLQKKTADELGEGAEVDLFDALKAAFPTDEIKRVKRGDTGADIIHTVFERKRTCGSIVYDSKNRTAWRNDYVRKLRRDQLAAKADHAILACHAFPAGARQVHVQDGVILANPARVLVLAEILRSQVVQLATARLGNQARVQKVARLYEFITSDHCTQLFDQIDSLTDAMLELEVKEKKTHDATWKHRGELIRSVQQARADLVSAIDLIIASPTAQLREAT